MSLQTLISRFSIRSRSLGTIVVVLASLALVGGAGLSGMYRMESLSKQFIGGTFADVNLLAKLQGEIANIRVTEREMVLQHENPAAIKEIYKGWKESVAKTVELIKELSQGSDEGVVAGALALQKRLLVYGAAFDPVYEELSAGVVNSASAGLTISFQANQEFADVQKRMAELEVLMKKQAGAAIAAQEASSTTTQWWFAVLVAISVLFVVAVTVLNMLSIIRPVSQMHVIVTEIAASQDFSRRVPVEGTDEIGMSIVAFNAMIGKIQESSQQLKQKTADIQAMMQYIPQGILTVMEGKKVHPEFSAYLETILETKDIAGRDLLELVFADSNFDAEIMSQVEAAVSACIGEDSMNFEFNAHLLVSEVEKKMPDGRVKILDLSWSPIADDTDTVVRLMLCVRDVTELKALAAAAGQQKRELDIIGQILAISQEKFSGFIDGSVQFLAENKKIIEEVGVSPSGALDPETVTQLFRNMHTIKGNARTYGLLHLTNMVHEAEQTYDDLRKNPDAVWDQEKLLAELASATSAIDEYAHINRVKLGRTGPGRRAGVEKYLMVKKQDIEEALELMKDSARGKDLGGMRTAYERVHKMLETLGTVRIHEVLEGIVESLPSLAQELSKEPPQITITDHNIVLRTQIADLLKNVFMHLYRNSMDHGIEVGSERVAKGKPAAGHIGLKLSLVDERLLLTLRDDGRGLAVERIRQKALQNGLITADQQLSAQEVAQLIFLAGFSTAEQVTEVSGRGVGMDAVQSFVQREEGTIALRLLSQAAADGYQSFETVISFPAKLAVQG